VRHVRWIVGLAISVVALFVAFRGVDWGAVGAGFRSANYWLLLASFPFLMALLLLKAHRWRLLFHPDVNIGLLPAFGALTIGYMTGTILPLQLGEVARTYVLAETQGIKKMRVLSTVAVERVLDTLILLVLLAALIPFVDVPGLASIAAAIALVALLVALAAIVLVVQDRTRAEQWLDRIVLLLPSRMQMQARVWRSSILDGLSALSNTSTTLQVIGWTAASWFASAIAIYLMLRAFDLDVPVAAAPFLLVATTLGFFLPSSPGAIGVYDAISIRTLTEIFSVPHADAVSFALVAHAMYSLPPTILGAFFVMSHRYSLRVITAQDRTTDPVDAAALEHASLADAQSQHP
jgi:uncharacterized protein (TIRG00374 family)